MTRARDWVSPYRARPGVAGHQADVLAECEARGIDPNPVMLLVLRRAPRLVHVIRDGELHPGPDTRYVDYRHYGFWAGSPEMGEALDFVLLADR